MSFAAKRSAGQFRERSSIAREFVWAGAFVIVVTALALAIEHFTGYLSIALLYLLLVVAAGLRLSWVPVLSLAAVSGFVWNFFFIPPRFTLYIRSVEDAMMFATFFIVAIAMGHLTTA